jgi:hypothetical protein
LLRKKRARIDNWDYIKLKSFCTTNSYQSDEKAYRMGEIFASYSSDKGLIPRIHKELRELNTKI